MGNIGFLKSQYGGDLLGAWNWLCKVKNRRKMVKNRVFGHFWPKNRDFWAFLGYFGLSRTRKLRRSPFPKFPGSGEAEIAQNCPKIVFLAIFQSFWLHSSQNGWKIAKNDHFWAILGYFGLSRARKLRKWTSSKFPGSRETEIAQIAQNGHLGHFPYILAT